MAKKSSTRKTVAEGETSNTQQPLDNALAESHDAMDTSASEAVTREDFETIYLRQATKEFAGDLEKLRTANDFRGDKSVQILVDALKQGTACYSPEEKQKLRSS